MLQHLKTTRTALDKRKNTRAEAQNNLEKSTEKNLELQLT